MIIIQLFQREKNPSHTKIHKAEKFQKMWLCEIYMNVAIILKSSSSTRTIMRVQSVGFWTRTQRLPQKQPTCCLTRNFGCGWKRRDSSHSLRGELHWEPQQNSRRQWVSMGGGQIWGKEKAKDSLWQRIGSPALWSLQFQQEATIINQILTNYKYYNKH